MLRDAGVATPELDARLLLCDATGLSHETYVAESRSTLNAEAATKLDAMIERRLGGEPVSRILGRREFYGREFRIDRHTLDPRPDTETLIEAVLDHVRANNRQDKDLRLIDLGTGTGCILLTLLAELPAAHGIGSDISEAALAVAAENARRLGLSDRASFVVADWFAGVEGTFDVILANPPYIASQAVAALAREVRDHDPLLALDGGADGLDAYRAIAAKAASFLAPGGVIFLEIGADQADAVRAIVRQAGLGVDDAVLRHDLSGRPRVVGANAPQQAATRSAAA